MAKVRVKIPAEPRIIEYPTSLAEQDRARAQALISTRDETLTKTAPNRSKAIQVSRRLLIVGIVTAVLILVGSLIVISRVSTGGSSATQSGSAVASSDKDIYAQASKLAVLPVNEMPTIASVSREDMAQQQLGIADVKEGDKVLFFAKSQKVVIYRPAENKIVAIASLARPQ